MATLQLPAKYPQLPALLIGHIETLIWSIHTHDNIDVVAHAVVRLEVVDELLQVVAGHQVFFGPGPHLFADQLGERATVVHPDHLTVPALVVRVGHHHLQALLGQPVDVHHAIVTHCG